MVFELVYLYRIAKEPLKTHLLCDLGKRCQNTCKDFQRRHFNYNYVLCIFCISCNFHW